MLTKGRALMAAIKQGSPEPTNERQASELAKHTPGHDKYGHFVVFESRSGTFRAAMPDAKTAATCAAAPDLLAACKAALKFGEGHPDRTVGWHDERLAVQVVLGAAIARAEGGAK